MKVDGLIEEQPTLEQQLESASKWRRVGDPETVVAGRARKELKRFTWKEVRGGEKPIVLPQNGHEILYFLFGFLLLFSKALFGSWMVSENYVSSL